MRSTDRPLQSLKEILAMKRHLENSNAIRGVLLVGSWVRGSDRGSGHCKLIQKSEPTKPALK